MKTSEAGKNLIRESEGLRLEAYRCAAGVVTIGYGHTEGVQMGQSISAAEAERLLEQDLWRCERLLNTMGIPFRQGQFDALASFIFNLGGGTFVSSTLCKKIQRGAADEEVAAEIVKWVHGGGKVLPGLQRRRVREANMYLGCERYAVKNKKIVRL